MGQEANITPPEALGVGASEDVHLRIRKIEPVLEGSIFSTKNRGPVCWDCWGVPAPEKPPFARLFFRLYDPNSWSALPLGNIPLPAPSN